jgi:hypothetical protein
MSGCVESRRVNTPSDLDRREQSVGEGRRARGDDQQGDLDESHQDPEADPSHGR